MEEEQGKQTERMIIVVFGRASLSMSMLSTARCKSNYHARKEIQDLGGFRTSSQRYISRKEQIGAPPNREVCRRNAGLAPTETSGARAIESRQADFGC